MSYSGADTEASTPGAAAARVHFAVPLGASSAPRRADMPPPVTSSSSTRLRVHFLAAPGLGSMGPPGATPPPHGLPSSSFPGHAYGHPYATPPGGSSPLRDVSASMGDGDAVLVPTSELSGATGREAEPLLEPHSEADSAAESMPLVARLGTAAESSMHLAPFPVVWYVPLYSYRIHTATMSRRALAVLSLLVLLVLSGARVAALVHQAAR
jgi:hypothetical protein